MLSFNHYAYGAMIDWVYRTVAGLAPDADDPGTAPCTSRRVPRSGSTHASASIDTRLGRLAIDWRVDGDVFEATLEVPFGARAAARPAGDRRIPSSPSTAPRRRPNCGHGTHRIAVTAPAVAPPSAVVPA